jgi:hypothetical protein
MATTSSPTRVRVALATRVASGTDISGLEDRSSR